LDLKVAVTEHPLDFDDHTPALVFSALGGFTCSICAPAAMTARQVESFATARIGPPPGGQWIAVDKSRLGLGRKTPEPCNAASGRNLGRRHWFLVDANGMKVKVDQARCA
jgi:hypothetical protein